jgi:hypothetical protein
MFGFKQYIPFLTEQKAPARGIQHLAHPSEYAFHARRGTVNSALSKIQSAANGKADISIKADDRMSFQAIRKPTGEVGVKYKGPGASYNFSESDVKKQYSEKPYIAGPMLHLLKHVHKVLPEGPGEYQGGYLSVPETREETDGKISHTPNTIKYSLNKNSPEGKKLAKSKLSIVLHSKLDENGAASMLDASTLREHPDVHVMTHQVTAKQKQLSPEAKRKVLEHIAAAKKLNKDHSHHHLEDHEETLTRYANSTIDTGEKPSAKGYVKFLTNYHQKLIDKVKTEKAKNQKTEAMKAAINHVHDNIEKFDRTFDIHHHIQKATYAVADALSKTTAGDYSHHIGGEEAAGEGFVSGGVKFVPRKFTEANRKRSAALKAQKSVI